MYNKYKYNTKTDPIIKPVTRPFLFAFLPALKPKYPNNRILNIKIIIVVILLEIENIFKILQINIASISIKVK